MRGAGTRRGPSASRSALRAWSRCQPVVAHNSSRITTLAPLDADRYRVAVALVTALRWLIVSPMFEAGPTPRCPYSPPRRRRAFLGEATTPVTRASLVSQLEVLTALQAQADARGEIDWRLSVDSSIARVHQHGATAARSSQGPMSHTGGTLE